MTPKYFSYRNVLITYLTWWVCWAGLQALALYYTAGLDLTLSIKDAILTNTLLALAGQGMIKGMQFYQPGQTSRLIYSIGISIICVFAMRWLALQFLSDDIAYVELWDKSMLIRCMFAWLMLSLIITIGWVWFYVREQQEIENRKTITEKLAREAELSKLRQQLQPHFLFNSLNSISALAGSRPEEARKMIQQLSDFLRGTLKRDEQHLVTLSEEMEHLQLYLEIEKVRFGHRLKTHVQLNDKAMHAKLPSLLLQPIVENAIKFGLYDTTGEIIIRIAALTSENYLVITVENPYDMATAQPKQGTGFGLNSVQRRLYLLYARHDLLSTKRDDVTFTTEIKIPQLI